jgi:YedE family putative selenium metabolism protein
MKDKKAYAGIVVTGAVIGLIAVVLVMLGNPKNMGFCIACFLRDIAGATKLHSAPVVQYFRPEIVGLIGGALIMAMVSKEFSPKGGSAPVTRFFLGAFVMIGALVFLGCPLRMVLRIGGGDLNAIVGLAGFAVGILVGIFFLNKGFSLKRTYKLTTSEGVGSAVCAVPAGSLPVCLQRKRTWLDARSYYRGSHRRSGRWRTLPEIPYVYGSRYPRPGSV